jgi:hypothetical protein
MSTLLKTLIATAVATAATAAAFASVALATDEPQTVVTLPTVYITASTQAPTAKLPTILITREDYQNKY